MKDYLDIGPCPAEEKAAQVGSEDCERRSKIECRAFINQLRRLHGPEPEGAKLGAKSFPHEFGNYLDVVCYYDSDLPDSLECAFKCESGTPARWDEIAKGELNESASRSD